MLEKEARERRREFLLQAVLKKTEMQKNERATAGFLLRHFLELRLG